MRIIGNLKLSRNRVAFKVVKQRSEDEEQNTE